MKNLPVKQKAFFYFTISLHILNILALVADIASLAKEITVHNLYFTITAFIMFMLYNYFYYEWSKHNYKNNIIVFSMCLYAIAFLVISEYQYIVNYILLAICLVLIFLAYKKNNIFLPLSVFTITYVIIVINKALDLTFNNYIIATRDPEEEIYLIYVVIALTLLLFMFQGILKILKILEKMNSVKTEREKFELNCYKKDITKTEKEILLFMLDELTTKQIIDVTGKSKSCVENHISNIKTKLNLTKFRKTKRFEIEKALYDDSAE